MSSERYRRARDILRKALEKVGGERDTFITEALADDSALGRKLTRVVRIADPQGTFNSELLSSLLWEAAEETPDTVDPERTGPGAGAHQPASKRTFRPYEEIGHYRVVGKIGEGGMGEVWRAVDTSLDRDVAIKFLPAHWTRNPQRLERFRREAKVLASLNHPNIVTVHAVDDYRGAPFIVLEFVEGRLLREVMPSGGLPVGRILEYAIPIADALGAAHARGITHRDLKPENVMLTPDERMKVLDFGLATRNDGTRDSAWPEEEGVREVAGTPPYMAPEQLRGQASGPHSDVFALGVLLYEMAVGRRPFAGSRLVDVVASVLHDPVPPPSGERPDLPAEFDALVAACLRKEPGDRPASSRPVLERLRELRRARERAALLNLATAGATLQASRAVAIAPFQDCSGGELGYVCTGVTQDVSQAASQLEGVRVIPVSRIDRTTVSPLEIGRMLNATAVLDGEVSRGDGGIRVSARLVRTGDGEVLWSEEFAHDAQGSQVRERVTQALARALDIRPRIEAPAPVQKSSAAYTAYLKGRFFWDKRYQGGLRRALQCFEEAIAQDDGLAAAHAGRADCFQILGHYGFLDPRIAYGEATREARRALDLDPNLAEAYTSMGWIKAFYEWSWDEAGTWFDRAVDLNPKYATAWEWKGLYLMARGRTQEAVAALQEAQRADPLSMMVSSIHAWVLHTLRENDEAFRILENVLEMDSRFVFAHVILGKMLATVGRAEEAIEVSERGAALSDGEGLMLAILAYAYSRGGRPKEAARVIDRIQESNAPYVAPIHLAVARLASGENDLVLDGLEAAVRNRESFFPSMYYDPVFDGLRGHPRFRAMMETMRLPVGPPGTHDR